MYGFRKAMEEMKRLSPDAYDWLTAAERPPKYWSKSHFNTYLKCDIVVNNYCESFNSWILESKSLQIISMFEDIRIKLMRRIARRKELMSKYPGPICPAPKFKLEQNKANARNLITSQSGGTQYQVDTSMEVNIAGIVDISTDISRFPTGGT